MVGEVKVGYYLTGLVHSGKSALKVREHKILGPYVENLSKLAVRSFKVG